MVRSLRPAQTLQACAEKFNELVTELDPNDSSGDNFCVGRSVYVPCRGGPCRGGRVCRDGRDGGRQAGERAAGGGC